MVKKSSYSLNVLKMLTDINAYTKLETAELSQQQKYAQRAAQKVKFSIKDFFSKCQFKNQKKNLRLELTQTCNSRCC